MTSTGYWVLRNISEFLSDIKMNQRSIDIEQICFSKVRIVGADNNPTALVHKI